MAKLPVKNDMLPAHAERNDGLAYGRIFSSKAIRSSVRSPHDASSRGRTSSSVRVPKRGSNAWKKVNSSGVQPTNTGTSRWVGDGTGSNGGVGRGVPWRTGA